MDLQEPQETKDPLENKVQLAQQAILESRVRKERKDAMENRVLRVIKGVLVK